MAGDGDELPNGGEGTMSDWDRFGRGRPSRRPLHSPPLCRPPTPFREMPTNERMGVQWKGARPILEQSRIQKEQRAPSLPYL